MYRRTEIRQSLDWKKAIEYVHLRHLRVIGMEKPGGTARIAKLTGPRVGRSPLCQTRNPGHEEEEEE